MQKENLSGFAKARIEAVQVRQEELYRLYGMIRRVLLEGRKAERADMFAELIRQQGRNYGGTMKTPSQDDLEKLAHQLAEIDKLEEVILIKDAEGGLHWLRLNGEKWA